MMRASQETLLPPGQPGTEGESAEELVRLVTKPPHAGTEQEVVLTSHHQDRSAQDRHQQHKSAPGRSHLESGSYRVISFTGNPVLCSGQRNINVVLQIWYGRCTGRSRI